MSFPNIPDITPDISITLEDATNLLLTSIAMEEISLSKLMDAETNKILCVLNGCKHKDSILNDAIEINKSVDDTIKNMIKLQMLLQFKLEDVKQIIPTTTTTTSTSTTTTTCTRTTTTKSTSSTTTCSTSTCSTTTKHCCSCSLIGKGTGCVSNSYDEFYGQGAFLYAYVPCCDVENRTIRYFLENDEVKLNMYAFGKNVRIECPSSCSDEITILGKGCIDKYSQCAFEFRKSVCFRLTIRNIAPRNLEFKMEFKSDIYPEFCHNSGFIYNVHACQDHSSEIFSYELLP